MPFTAYMAAVVDEKACQPKDTGNKPGIALIRISGEGQLPCFTGFLHATLLHCLSSGWPCTCTAAAELVGWTCSNADKLEDVAMWQQQCTLLHSWNGSTCSTLQDFDAGHGSFWATPSACLYKLAHRPLC